MTYFYATLAIIGIILAGSDGPYFPIPNFAGLLLVFTCLHLGEESMHRSSYHGR